VATVTELKEPEMEKLKRIVKDAKFLLETNYPPVNSLAMLNEIKDILELAKTNSFLCADPKLKYLAIPFIVQLLDHVLSAGNLCFHSPKSYLWLAEGKSIEEMSVLELCVKVAKRTVDELADKYA